MGIKFLQNIDAERNKFEEAGFEVVNQLPTTNLFVGREMIFNGLKYMYENSEQGWVRQRPLLDRYFKAGDINNYGNFFSSQKSVYISTIHDALYAADKRYNVTVVIYNSDESVYENRSGDVLFDGNYESQFNIPAGKKCVITIQGNKLFSMYPYGRIWLQTYPYSQEKSVSCRVYANYASTGIGWFNLPMNKLGPSISNQYVSNHNSRFNLSVIEITVVAADDKPAILTEIEMALDRPSIVDFPVLLKHGGTMYGTLSAPEFIKTGGTATQMLMADGSTKEISGFASPADIPEKLPCPNPIVIKTADGVSVRYDGSASGGVILEAGDNAELTATQDSDDTMTVKFGAIVPTKLPNPQAMTIQVLDDAGAILGSDILYDGLTAKILKLVAGYGIELISSNLTGGQAVGINLKQIAGTTLLGNKHGGTGTPAAITMNELRSMLGSLTINSLSIMLGGNSTYTLPCYMELGGTYYQVRLSNNSLQIYRNGVWAEYGRFCQCSASGGVTVGNLTDWFLPGTLNYAFDSDVSKMVFDTDIRDKGFGTKMSSTWGGEKTTLNLEFVNISDTKSAWEIMKENLRSCFPEGVGKVRFAYNVAIPSGEVKTRIEMSYKGDVGVVTTTFYTEG